MRAGARLVLLAGLFACAKSEQPAPAPVAAGAPVAAAAPVRTDRPRYQMGEGPFGPQTTIVTTFTAPAGRSARLTNCNGAISVGLQRLEGNAWVHAWAVEMNGCLSPPIVLPPGGSRTERLVVASGADALVSSRRNSSDVRGGTYRVVWHAVEGLPIEQRASAPFVIDAAPPHDPARESPPVRPPEIVSVEPVHGVRAGAEARVRVRFARPLRPQLYVDGEHTSEVEPPLSDVLEYAPKRGWSPGLHQLRVVWQDEQRELRWYAWSFTASPSSPVIPADVKPGASIAGLRVTSSTLKPAVNGGHVGDVRFAGEVTVEGQFERHFDSDVKDPCFFVDPLSKRQLPRVTEDERKSWFCFSNPEAVRKAFGSAPAPGTRATIRIADFHYVFHYSDVFNVARFVGAD